MVYEDVWPHEKGTFDSLCLSLVERKKKESKAKFTMISLYWVHIFLNKI